MKNYTPFKTLFFGLFYLLPTLVWAQIELTYPVSRMVFQRSKANNATIRIGGITKTPVNRVEVRAIPLNGGNDTGWVILQDNPQGGAFAGTLTLNAGWYELQVRGLRGDEVISGRGVDRLGVGEVFLIAGQSNAQGFFTYGSPRANDDRVNCVNYSIDGGLPTTEPPFPTFSHLEADMYISPRGNSSWYWGRLGDLLAARLNVPILFFNAAWTATSSENWRSSAEGRPTFGAYSSDYQFPAGQPYGNLKVAMQFYAHSLGMRAILWHQGETDSYQASSADTYSSNLRVIIQKSREHSGKNVSWVVARASYDDDRKSNAAVLAGQDQVINSVPNVFPGPNTDVIQVPRTTPTRPTDNVHFQDGFLNEVAMAWSNSLTDQFFANSIPYSPALGPTLSAACAGTNQMTINVNGGGNVTWNNGATGGSLLTSSGRYMATVKDDLGNATFTPSYEVPARPAITTNGTVTLCKGGSVTLTSSYQDATRWSNGAVGSSISVSTANTFVASFRDGNGCEFTSDPVTVTVNPLPDAPTIRSLRPIRFCDRESTTLEGTEATAYVWSNGERSRQVEIRKAGVYFLQVTDQNGCTSPESNRIEVLVDPLPARPVIATNGPTTFCADQNVTLTSSAETAYNWQGGQTSRSITVNQSGDYSVRTRNVHGCVSDPSNVVSVRVNPLPPAPLLSASGPTTFCDGDRVTLTASSSFRVFWTTGDSAQSIVATRSGRYTARVRDANGCFSPASASLVVDVKELPSLPIIRQAGTYTLQGSGSVNGDYYEWTLDNALMPNRTEYIKTTQRGLYRVRAFRAYENGLICQSGRSEPFSFVPFLDNGGLSVYPNPSPDRMVAVETFDNIENAVVTVYTLTGQEVLSARVAVFNERKFIDLRQYPSGQYLIQVKAPGFRATKRILIGQ